MVKKKESFNKRKIMCLLILIGTSFVYGYFTGKVDTQGDLLSVIAIGIVVGLLLSNLFKKIDKEKKK